MKKSFLKIEIPGTANISGKKNQNEDPRRHLMARWFAARWPMVAGMVGSG